MCNSKGEHNRDYRGVNGAKRADNVSTVYGSVIRADRFYRSM